VRRPPFDHHRCSKNTGDGFHRGHHAAHPFQHGSLLDVEFHVRTHLRRDFRRREAVRTGAQVVVDRPPGFIAELGQTAATDFAHECPR